MDENFQCISDKPPSSQDLTKDSKLIVFIIGGISTVEIAAIQQLQKEHDRMNVVIGSTEHYTARDFINLLADKSEMQH